MKLDIASLKTAIAAKGYTWFNDLNLIGVRTTLQVPDAFNDFMCVIWTQSAMPAGLSPIDQQDWLNKNLFVGADGTALTLDGDFGPKSQYALAQYNAVVGKERLKVYTITTDPGAYWLEHPMNTLGAAVLKPGQWTKCWSLGFHQGKPDHEALVQTGTIQVYRDGDKDNIAEASATLDKGLFGINIHGSNKVGTSLKIGKWSAGCQVFNQWDKKEEFISICKMFKTAHGNKFTYTLIEEKDLAA